MHQLGPACAPRPHARDRIVGGYGRVVVGPLGRVVASGCRVAAPLVLLRAVPRAMPRVYPFHASCLPSAPARACAARPTPCPLQASAYAPRLRASTCVPPPTRLRLRAPPARPTHARPAKPAASVTIQILYRDSPSSPLLSLYTLLYCDTILPHSALPAAFYCNTLQGIATQIQPSKLPSLQYNIVYCNTIFPQASHLYCNTLDHLAIQLLFKPATFQPHCVTIQWLYCDTAPMLK